MDENDILLEQLKDYLQDSVGKIESGECKLSHEGAQEILSVFKKYTEDSREFTKTEAAEYLHTSKSTFDRMVRDGKIPRGHKRKRNRILTWSKSDLDKVL